MSGCGIQGDFRSHPTQTTKVPPMDQSLRDETRAAPLAEEFLWNCHSPADNWKINQKDFSEHPQPLVPETAGIFLNPQPQLFIYPFAAPRISLPPEISFPWEKTQRLSAQLCWTWQTKLVVLLRKADCSWNFGVKSFFFLTNSHFFSTLARPKLWVKYKLMTNEWWIFSFLPKSQKISLFWGKRNLRETWILGSFPSN